MTNARTYRKYRPSSYGSRLSSRRNKRSFTWDQIARMTGVSVLRLKAFINCRKYTFPTHEEATRIHQEIGVSPPTDEERQQRPEDRIKSYTRSSDVAKLKNPRPAGSKDKHGHRVIMGGFADYGCIRPGRTKRQEPGYLERVRQRYEESRYCG